MVAPRTLPVDIDVPMDLYWKIIRHVKTHYRVIGDEHVWPGLRNCDVIVRIVLADYLNTVVDQRTDYVRDVEDITDGCFDEMYDRKLIEDTNPKSKGDIPS